MLSEFGTNSVQLRVRKNGRLVPKRHPSGFLPRAYGLDVGWNKTAAIWGARNPETGVIYLYSEYYRGQAEPQVHVEAIMPPNCPQKSEWEFRCDWARFVATTNSRMSSVAEFIIGSSQAILRKGHPCVS